jgi:hypothetical protein
MEISPTQDNRDLNEKNVIAIFAVEIMKEKGLYG